MTYRVELEGRALLEFHHLPAGARDALIARVAELTEAPWDGATAHPDGGRAFRDAAFGDGDGLLEFHVDEGALLIRIRTIVWSGP